MQVLIGDVRYALRQLRRSPGFTLTVVLTLAIGIGMNAAIFAVVDCVLLRPLGYHDADRIVALQTHFLEQGHSIPRLGGDDYRDLAEQVHGLQATAYYQHSTDALALHGATLYLPVATVSPKFTEVLGVAPVAGRLFRSGDRDGQEALVSAAFAREHFGSAQGALGAAIAYGGADHTVVGVLPGSFTFPGSTAVWFENPATPKWGERSSFSYSAIAKRRPGVSLAQLEAELGAFSRQLGRSYAEDRQNAIEAIPLQDQLVRPVRGTLHLLMGAVAVLLLVVCANITHLQLVRGMRQQRATSIRTALGVSRQALVRAALLEAALLATAGGGAALLLAAGALRVLLTLAPAEIPRLAEVRLNGAVFLFSLLLSAAVMSVAAVLPLRRSLRLTPASALRQSGSRGTESRESARLRDSFVVAEVALTLTLSLAAVVVARQLLHEARADLGFAPEHLITLDVHAMAAAQPAELHDLTPAAVAAYKAATAGLNEQKLARLNSALASLASVPGAEAAAAISGAPMGFDSNDASYAVAGKQVFSPAALQKLPNADFKPVTPTLLRTLGVPLLHGRELSPADRSTTPLVALVNQELARQSFGGQDPIGQQIVCGYDENTIQSPVTIVGIVGDTHDGSPGAPPRPTFYIPVAQHAAQARDMQLVVRVRGESRAMAETLHQQLGRTHPELAVKATTMRENIGATERGELFQATLLGSFAGFSLLLAAVGMYAVTAFTVSQRRFELSLRSALGATRTQLLRLVLGHALAAACVGLVCGFMLSLCLFQVLRASVALPGSIHPAACVLAAGVVLTLALLANLLPAHRAASADPAEALRTE